MRIRICNVLPLITIILLSGCCGNSLHLVSEKGRQCFHEDAFPVYVTNPEMRQEYEILKASGIYKLSDQPDGAHRLTLRPIQRHGGCGNPLMLTMFTFGIVPGVLPARRTFEYDLSADGVAETYIHFLPLYERFSAWEWLVKGNEKKVIAKALAWSTRQRQSDLSAQKIVPSY